MQISITDVAYVNRGAHMHSPRPPQIDKKTYTAFQAEVRQLFRKI